MIKFTKEEISLCEQVAEKHRKEIKKGDWVIERSRANIPLFVIDTQMEYITLSLGYQATYDTTYRGLTPLWTISDCLEFLREKDCWARIDIDEHYTTRIRVFNKKGLLSSWGMYPYHLGKTPLEACLKAILAVLEEGK